jgi:hypothetical protein
MAQQGINVQLVEIALDRVKGDTFESFINAFYPTIAGEKFVPWAACTMAALMLLKTNA